MDWDTIHTLITLILQIGLFVGIYFIIRGIWRAIKRFTFEIIDRTNGTGPKDNTNQKDQKPPWEG